MHIDGMQIALRDWQLDDLEAFAYWLRPEHRWQELDGPYYPKTPLEMIPLAVARVRDQIEAGEWPEPRQRLAIADQQTNRLLGQVSWYWTSQETNWLSVGIVIYDPAHWGRGLGLEALGLWGDYLLAAMPQLARLDLRTWSGNLGMMRLAEKLGYQLEARFRDARIVNGEYYDGLGYGVLRAEWRQRYPDGFAAYLRSRDGAERKAAQRGAEDTKDSS
ncbi:MAG: GNAT family N-acetyltransferase [Anaerolineales bacterium]|nr:GNAT family N-acetyltransferase [Anaerolineales bacterium]